MKICFNLQYEFFHSHANPLCAPCRQTGRGSGIRSQYFSCVWKRSSYPQSAKGRGRPARAAIPHVSRVGGALSNRSVTICSCSARTCRQGWRRIWPHVLAKPIRPLCASSGRWRIARKRTFVAGAPESVAAVSATMSTELSKPRRLDCVLARSRPLVEGSRLHRRPVGSAHGSPHWRRSRPTHRA